MTDTTSFSRIIIKYQGIIISGIFSITLLILSSVALDIKSVVLTQVNHEERLKNLEKSVEILIDTDKKREVDILEFYKEYSPLFDRVKRYLDKEGIK